MELSRKAGGGPASALVVEVARYAGAARSHLRDEGLPATLRAAARLVRARATRPTTVARRQGRTFSIGAATLGYELGSYNNAWLNERSVEVSLAKHVLSGISPKDVLEVGNVLSRYGRSGHTIVDKYEDLDGVDNADILDYQPGRTFDAVVALSTLEHVGFDDPVKNPMGPAAALDALRKLVSPTGFVLVTVPLGYNPDLDDLLTSGQFACARQFGLRRRSADNDWVEDNVESIVGTSYGSPFTNANAVYVGVDGPGAQSVRI